MAELENFTADLQTAQTHIVAGRIGDAKITLDQLLHASPSHIDALYMRAVTARYEKDYKAAHAFLTKLKAAAPDFGRAYQEEGHLLRERGDNEKALSAFQNACRLNPALIASWRAQGELLKSFGHEAEAHQCTLQYERLAALPKELAAVTTLIYEGKLLKAERLCRNFLKQTPHHIEAMRLLAEIGVRYGVLNEAEFLLESAAEFEPENIQVRLDLIQVLRKQNKHQKALKLAAELYNADIESPVFQSNYAIQSMLSGDFEKSFALFDRVLEKLPNDAATLTSRGHALKTFGKLEEAVSSYQKAYAANPNHGDAYYSLANLKTYKFNDDEVASMKDLLACDGLDFLGRIHVNFALGKAYEDRGQYDSSFDHYLAGNELKRVQCRYDPDQMGQELADQAQICTDDFFNAQAQSGFDAPDPIFIVGLPRAGSTLLEQILASHSQVDGTQELPNILSLAHRLKRSTVGDPERDYPRLLRFLDAEKLKQLGESYINDTRHHRKTAPYFIDKMPNNFRHIGLIHLILPNAKIIDARREPMSCCFSGFKQLFAEGQEFTYGLANIGRYYRDYVTLMDHWTHVLSGKILHVQYEDVVDDLEPQVRRILDFCELPFEESCVEFYKTDRAVRTASSEQVRTPINKKGLDAWRPFEARLGELKTALGGALTNYRRG